MQCHIPKSCAFVAAGVLLTASLAVAGQTPAATTLTFDRAVRVPGVTLPAGTYVFKRVGADHDQRTVQIYQANPRRLVATLMAVPTVRDGGGADVVFGDTPKGGLPVLRAWYERGTQNGYSFIYGSAELARLRKAPAVLATD